MKKIIVATLIFSFIFGLFHINTISAAKNSEQFIIINKSTNKLAYFNKGEIVKIFDVATGKSDSLTPEGSFMIVNKIKNRPYYKDRIPGGHPSNPLGDRWLGLNARGTYGTTYAIHGNSNPKSIGKYVSGGCVRMFDEEVRWLFDELNLYTPVIIGHFDSFENAAQKAGYELLPPVEVVVNGEVLSLEQPPSLQEGRVSVPLRSLFSALGATVVWDGATNSITATKGNRVTQLTIDQKEAYINGEKVVLDVPAKITNGRTFVPARFVTEALGSKIAWDSDNRRITIYLEGDQQVPEEIQGKEDKEDIQDNEEIQDTEEIQDIEDIQVPDEVNVIINGKVTEFEKEVLLENGVVIVPLEETLEQLGAYVTWDEEKELLVAEKAEKVIEFYLIERQIYYNGELVQIDPEFQTINEATYIPANLLSELFEVSVRWLEESRSLEING